MHYNGKWDAICDDGWVLNDAEVVCREPGFGQAIADRSEGYYGQGSGQVWLFDLSCTGTESSIVIFLHNEWEVDDSNRSSDVSISCAVPKYFLLEYVY